MIPSTGRRDDAASKRSSSKPRPWLGFILEPRKTRKRRHSHDANAQESLARRMHCPSARAGRPSGNPLEFHFISSLEGAALDVRGDQDGPYVHQEYGIKAMMSPKGIATLDTWDSARGLLVDFYPDEDWNECILGPCVRPTTLPSTTDPVFVPPGSLWALSHFRHLVQPPGSGS